MSEAMTTLAGSLLGLGGKRKDDESGFGARLRAGEKCCWRVEKAGRLELEGCRRDVLCCVVVGGRRREDPIGGLRAATGLSRSRDVVSTWVLSSTSRGRRVMALIADGETRRECSVVEVVLDAFLLSDGADSFDEVDNTSRREVRMNGESRSDDSSLLAVEGNFCPFVKEAG